MGNRSGWRREPARHSLAARGLRSGKARKPKPSRSRSVPSKSGGWWFNTIGHGKTAKDAYDNAFQNALYEHGHDPYNGTISTTYGFIDLTEEAKKRNMSASEFSDHIVRDESCNLERDFDICKGGKCGAVKVRDGVWLFFGWAAT